MNEISIVDGIIPLSEFRSKMADFIERTRLSRGPLVLTQHGKSVAVVMSPAEYEALTERQRVVEAVNEGIRSLEEDGAIPHEEVEEYFAAKRDALRDADKGASLSDSEFEEVLARADKRLKEDRGL